METGHYIAPGEIIFKSSGYAGDIEFKAVPKGFYLSLVQDALNELNLASMYLDARHDYVIDAKLKFILPPDCIRVDGVWVFSGDECNISHGKKVYWKRNYYNRGGSYIANNKAQNDGDPYIVNTSGMGRQKNMTKSADTIHNGLLFYEIENNELRISDSCMGAGTKIHIKYKSSGGIFEETPVIPIIFKDAITDYVTEGILMFRMANEAANAPILSRMADRFSMRLDKNGMNGSWQTAVVNAKRYSKAKMDDLKTYMAHAPWGTGR